MAHFAKIENGLVTDVLVIPDSYESDGQSYLSSLGIEGTWIQTSYNANIRTKFASIGDIYNSKKDRFEPAKPFQSWKWNEEIYAWQAPKAHPNDGATYDWDEATTSWVAAE